MKSSTQSAHIAELTGLRALAVFMVLLGHTNSSFQTRFLIECASKLWVGVDIFFVLSGFLITRILLAARGSQNYFFVFYMRRILRIWPLYFCVLLAGFIVFHLQIGSRSHAGPLPWPFIFFVQNLQSVSQLWRIKQLDVTWSLAVEEQFYLIWPLIVALFSPRTLLWICSGLFLISPFVRILFVLSGSEATSLYYNTLCRMDGLAAGACLALCCYHNLDSKRLFRGFCIVLAAVCIPMTFAIVRKDAFLGNMTAWTLTIPALASFGLIGIAIQAAPTSLFRRALRNSVVRYVGEVSYGLYLLHRFVLIPLANLRMQWIYNTLIHDTAIFLLGFMLCLLLASLSWYCMERPMLRMKQYFAFSTAPTVRAELSLAGEHSILQRRSSAVRVIAVVEQPRGSG